MEQKEKKPLRSRRHQVGESRGSCPPNWFVPGTVVVLARPLNEPIDDLPGCYNQPTECQCAPRTDDPTK